MKNPYQVWWACAAVFAVFVFGWAAVRAIRWAKKGTKAGSMLAAAAFPFPDRPPPYEQVENANRLKKDTESGDPE
jgi:hypothetical protein